MLVIEEEEDWEGKSITPMPHTELLVWVPDGPPK